MRALQVLVAKSYFAGQTKITCLGMGIPAVETTSVFKQWCPKDLISTCIFTCSNPVAIARNIGDLPSQDNTIGKHGMPQVPIMRLYSLDTELVALKTSIGYRHKDRGKRGKD